MKKLKKQYTLFCWAYVYSCIKKGVYTLSVAEISESWKKSHFVWDTEVRNSVIDYVNWIMVCHSGYAFDPYFGCCPTWILTPSLLFLNPNPYQYVLCTSYSGVRSMSACLFNFWFLLISPFPTAEGSDLCPGVIADFWSPCQEPSSITYLLRNPE